MEGDRIACDEHTETSGDGARNRQRITADNGWMPRSWNGPYSTIPFSSGIDEDLLVLCGMQPFLDARHVIKLLASDYAARAVALVAKAKAERAALAREFSDADPVIRPHRVRLCLELDETNGRLYLCWRGVHKRKDRYIRERAPLWNCRSDLSVLVAHIHPAEALLIQQIEAEAADIRRRWFALVRLVHYLNVAEDFRLADLEAGSSHHGIKNSG